MYHWRLWARPNQLPPPGDWLTWLLLAGRGFGKTRCGAEWVRSIATGRTPLGPSSHSRIAIVAETAADARDVLVEGESGILRITPKDFRPMYEPSKRRLTWPNGAVGTLYNAVEPDQLRGPQHDAAWADELAKWMYAQETYDQLQFGLRLGNKPQQVITTTPRPIPVIKDIIKAEGTVITKGSTYDNAANLAPAFVNKIITRFKGTRLGRQELEAEILDDVVGALWTRTMIDDHRVSKLPDMQRIVVAIDPSGSPGEDSLNNQIGIVVAGLGIDGHGYVMEDLTCSLSPEGWARVACQAYHWHQADLMVAEVNYGGAMVQAVIAASDSRVPFKQVHASRGKAVRAEPVAALYEQGRIHHLTEGCEALEDQMCQMTPTVYLGKGSPDRLDAMVWAFTELMLGEYYTLEGVG